MTREELTEKVLASESDNFILELATGTGKTLVSVKKIAQWHTKGNQILVVIPKLILIENWKAELIKFKYDYLLEDIKFTTYVSLPKCAGNKYECIVLDEGHHTSERCMEALEHISTRHLLVLSATLKKEHRHFFNNKYNIELIKIGTKEAIDSNILPDPKLILIPLSLDNNNKICAIEKNIKKTTKTKDIKVIDYSQKWSFRSYTGPLRIMCTQKQYYDDISNLIEWYKNKGMFSSIMKNRWLHKAGERLKWLACEKEDLIKQLLRQLKRERLIVFCPSIKNSDKLGCYCVNSKIGTENLDKFNNGEINHIAAIDMLTEGANLSECKIAIFQMINSSERMQVQKIGRALRHKKPVLIFPYYVGTREQEIVKEIISNYNPELIVSLEVTTIKTKLKKEII